MKEVYAPPGGDWGGNNIDDALVALVDQIFGAEIMKSYKVSLIYAWAAIIINCPLVLIGQVPAGVAGGNGGLRDREAERVP
jgi:hypothetical protein